jgi:hypothetical protein
MATMDAAFTQVCTDLKSANLFERRKKIKFDVQVTFFFSLFLLESLLNTLLYFWLTMDSRNWNFSIVAQVFIYIGFFIGVFLQSLILIVLSMLAIERGRIWCKLSSNIDPTTVGIVSSVVVSGIVVIALTIYKHSLLQEDED